MLFRQADLAAIAAGEVTLAFRRWTRPMARAGGSQRTPAGVVAFDAVERVDEITPEDARRAGFADPEAAWAMLRGREGDLYRVALRLAGPDPRIALREDPALDPGIAVDFPDTTTFRLSPELRAALGRDTLSFKVDVRKLKALGLTESLLVGYRLSPRGRAYLSES